MWRPALAGVLGVALGLGVAELAAGLLGRTATPFVTVGEAFIDVVPGWLKDLAIDWFGTSDKAVLLAGMAVVFVVGSAAAGILVAARPDVGVVVLGVVVVALAAVVLSRPDTTAIDVVPTAVGGLVALLVIPRLARRARSAVAEAQGEVPAGARGETTGVAGAGRRSFLVGASVAGVLAVA